jgi:hypothetical protein
MVKRERVTLAAAGVALAVLAAVLWLRPGAVTPGVATGGGERGADATSRGGPPPLIGLGQLTGDKPKVEVGKRDLFAFPAPPPPPPTPEPPPTMATPPPPPTVPTPTPLPALNVKYIGTLESQPGLKVAMFMTDRKEVLTGQVGDTVGNRFKVVKIGLESVDVQQVGADRTERLPLKGN